MNGLQNIRTETIAKINNFHWAKNTAGRKMLSRDFIPVIRPQQTMKQIVSEIKENISRLKTINYLYVVNEQDELIGVASIKEIFRQPSKVKISQIMDSRLITTQPEVDQKKVAHLALKNNIKAVPVIDKNNHFLGIITSDRILAILNKEARENIYHLTGVYPPKSPLDDAPEFSVAQSFKRRVPWLLLGMIGGIFSAQVIGFFEVTLERNLILAAFIPLIVYMSDAVGTQMEALIIRDLVVHPEMVFKKYFLRQTHIAFLIASFCGVLLSLFTFIFYQQVYLGIVLGISIFVAVNTAIFTGMIIPYLFNKLKMDPALCSGPLATVIQDILSVVIYFGVANLLL